MRPLEIYGALSVVVAALLLPRLRSRFWIVSLSVSVGFAIQGWVEGPHWQLLPLYLALLLLWIATPIIRSWRGRGATVIAVASMLLVFASVFLCWLMPMFRLPRPTGSYAVGTRILYLVDQGRREDNGPSPSGKRELMLQTWYPASPPTTFAFQHLANYQRRTEVTRLASYRSVLKTHSFLDAAIHPGAPYPVLLYNPGWMGERTEGTFQAEELASHGFVVVAVDHTFFGGLVQFPDGRITDSHTAPQLGSFDHSTAAEQSALGDKFVRIEAQDDAFVLDELTRRNQDSSSPWFHKLDLSRVGTFGFSIGGAASAQFAYQDPRVKAALNMDGWTFGDVGIHGLAKPFMVFYEEKGQTIPTEAQLHAQSPAERAFWQFSAEDYARVNSGMRKNGGYLLFLEGARHVDFTDRSLLSPLRRFTGGGPIDPVRAHSITNRYTLAFFAHTLKGEDQPLLAQNPAPYSEVEVHFFPGGETPLRQSALPEPLRSATPSANALPGSR